MEKQSYIQILRLSGVLERTGIKRSTLLAFIKDGKFPAPIPLGVRSRGWDAMEVEEWLQSRKASRG